MNLKATESSLSPLTFPNFPVAGRLLGGELENSLSFSELFEVTHYYINTRIIDTLGDSHPIGLLLVKVGRNTWQIRVFTNSEEVGESVSQKPRLLPITRGKNRRAIRLRFDTSGKLTGMRRLRFKIKANWQNGSDPDHSVKIVFRVLTQYASNYATFLNEADGSIPTLVQ